MTQEIVLNHLTINEYVKLLSDLPDNDWENYKKAVLRMFIIKELHFFESELLQDFNAKSMDELLKSYPDRFQKGGKKNIHLKDFSAKDFTLRRAEINKIRDERGGWKEEDYENVWFDLYLERFNITPEEPYYEEFLIYQLRNLELIGTDDFLNYQLETHFENNIQKFKRFVTLSMRMHAEKLMEPDQIKTVEEWLNMVEAKPELLGSDEAGKLKKSKINREAGDNLTALSLIQTAYFINLLKNAGIIVKNEKLLPDSRAGEAFNVLTGYSEHTLRLRLGLKGSEEVTYSDRKAVRDILHKMINHVNKEIEEQRGNKP